MLIIEDGSYMEACLLNYIFIALGFVFRQGLA